MTVCNMSIEAGARACPGTSPAETVQATTIAAMTWSECHSD